MTMSGALCYLTRNSGATSLLGRTLQDRFTGEDIEGEIDDGGDEFLQNLQSFLRTLQIRKD